jgi:hypothetical protein
MTGSEGRQRKLRIALAHGCQHRDAGSDDRGLGVEGEGKLAVRAFEAELRDWPAERGVGRFEHFARRFRAFEEGEPHADGLAALTRKKPGALHIRTRALAQETPAPSAHISTVSPG